MHLDIKNIKAQKGIFSCHLWENANIGLPLALFYSLKIPLAPFHSGHEYVPQPCDTEIELEWLKFTNSITGKNERNWKYLVGKEFITTSENETGEGSIYLGSEHCQCNCKIEFLALNDNTFDVELTLCVDFNIETINLDENGNFTLRTQVEFQGLFLYDDNALPTLATVENKLEIISDFIDNSVYSRELVPYKDSNLPWKQLKPLP